MSRKIFAVAVFIIISVILCPFGAFAAQTYPTNNISAKSAILIDATTGKVLFEKNSGQIMPMASTTKIMTTLLALESGNLDEYFVVDPQAIRVEGSSMGLVEGDEVTQRALCYGMMLPSGNDAANVTAVRIGGSIEGFAQLMNKRAKQIGMTKTNFVTPSGLDDDTDYHYSTAYDMALLTREALKNPDFRVICSSPRAELNYGNPPFTRWLYNSNKLLKSYKGIIGVKTGFTDKARRCLVSACERDGTTLICVTLNAPSDWNDHVVLYDYGYSVAKKEEVPMDKTTMLVNVVGATKDTALVKQQRPARITAFSGEKPPYQKEVCLPMFIYAQTQKGEVVGRADYIVNGEVVDSVPVVLSENLIENNKEKKQSIFDRIKNIFSKS